MPFEVFSSYGAGSRDTATLRASGYLFIPRAMMLSLGAAEAREVVLLYDKDALQIAVQLPGETDPQHVRREVIREKSGTAVNIMPLLRANKLSQPRKKVKLPAHVEDLIPMVVIDVRELSGMPF